MENIIPASELMARADELRRHPSDSRACAELADITAKLGDYASAIDHDARAWELGPDDPTPLLHILAMLVDSGKWLGAMTAFELVRDSARPETALALDLAAVEVFRRIVGVFPPRGARPEADRIVDRVMATSQGRGVAIQAAVVRSLIDLGRTADAASLLGQLDPVETSDRAHVYFLHAALCERSGDIAAACTLYEQALALEARTDAAINLLSLLVESESITRVPAVLARLDGEARKLPIVRFHEAIYLRRIGDQDRAVALLSPIACDRTTELGRMARQVLASC